jgi:hypothetical protein
MSKKSFPGIDSLLGGGATRQPEQATERATVRVGALVDAAKPTIEEKPAVAKKRGRPQTNFRDIDKSSQEGCKESETRATFIVNEADLERIKAMAYWERIQIKDAINAALREYIARYEAKNGPVQPKPEKR